jgi:hypothetical protein
MSLSKKKNLTGKRWSKSEDEILFDLCNNNINNNLNWLNISEALGNKRSIEHIKNRWYTVVSVGLKKG